jgi:thiamine-monophosphate kinase
LSQLRDIGEDALIERLIALVPRDMAPAAGPGDDCAVVDPGPEHSSLVLLKTDALVGHVHFLPETPARAVGWKAIARVVSDFAAMGGKPDRFLVTIALPAETEVAWAEDLYRGMGDCLRAFGAVLAGGESSSVPIGSAPVISIAATGSVERSKLVLRSTGKSSDALLVTGLLGGSIHGKHLNFTPRIKESDWLVSNYKPTAMMDVSDGLAKDLPRLAAASGCGWVIDRAAVPCTPGVGIDAALGDGEDFELLFSFGPERVEALLADWASVFPDLPLTLIGQLTPVDEGNSLSGGWDHFGNLGLR